MCSLTFLSSYEYKARICPRWLIILASISNPSNLALLYLGADHHPARSTYRSSRLVSVSAILAAPAGPDVGGSTRFRKEQKTSSTPNFSIIMVSDRRRNELTVTIDRTFIFGTVLVGEGRARLRTTVRRYGSIGRIMLRWAAFF